MPTKKARPRGVAETTKAILRHLERSLKTPINRLASYEKLKRAKFKVLFVHEGGIQILLPKLSVFRALTSDSKKLENESEFFSRPSKEALLRKIVFELFKEGYLERHKSVIDIGCWLADNTLVWASLLGDNAVVHAIDLSLIHI